MLDSALRDTAEENDELINFDKHRKEFEVLTQIRLLQASAALYRIEPDADFWLKFCSIPVNSDNERFFSCDLMYSIAVSYSCRQFMLYDAGLDTDPFAAWEKLRVK